MRKKIFALLSAAVLSVSMTVTAFAAPSPSADKVATTTSGQVISKATLTEFVSKTKLETSVSGAKIETVKDTAAASLVKAANETVGSNATVATMVDIDVPQGTGSAEFTLKVSSLVAGQSVTVLHLKKDGTVEKLPVSSVKNGSVTFTMTSYSPVAVIVDAAAPKTAEANTMVIMIIAMAGVAGAVVCGRKFARN